MAKSAKLYNADDIPSHFTRKIKKPHPTKLRKAIQPGLVLILLAGRFKGRRVVFLKQLKSGLLLVTGPYKLNGVPLKRVNQAYVIPTSTKVDISGAKVDKISDDYFKKAKVTKTGVGKNTIFDSKTTLSAEEKAKIDQKKKTQAEVDKSLLDVTKKTELLGSYLKSRFTLRNNTHVHDLKF